MDDAARPRLGYLSDKATEIDLFGAGAIARVIVRLIRETSDDPIAIGVYGEGGAGKSSILAMVAAAAAKSPEIVCLAVDGLRIGQGDEDAQIALVESLALGLVDQRFRDAEGDGDVARALKALAGLRAAFPAAQAAAGGVPAVPPAVEFRAALAQLMGKAGVARLVIFIDDLDCLSPGAAIRMLEAIRRLAFLDKIAFLIGLDETRLEQANRADVSAPLAKLIDAPFKIPALGAAEAKIYVVLLLLGAALGETSEAFAKARALGRAALVRPWDANGFQRRAIEIALGASGEGLGETIAMAEEISPLLAAGAKGNPRRIKQFLNALALRLAVAAERGFGEAIERPRLAKLMLAERFLPTPVFEHIAHSIAGSRDGICPELVLIEAEVRAEPAARDGANAVLADWRSRPEVVRWAAIAPALGGVSLKPYLFAFEGLACDLAPPVEQSPQPAALAARSGMETEAASGRGGLLALALLALVVGAASGLIGALFRLSLERADHLRNLLIAWAHGEKLGGFLVLIAACGLAAALAAWLVRRFSPFASGSGIPHVEAVLNGELPHAPFRLIPVKFFGGLLAIGSGLALGREGPSVQMGASLAHLIGKIFRRDWPDCRVLFAAGAGAGLATAFNAPIAGAVFVLEELVRRFEPRIAIAALGASATAIALSRVLLGNAPDFQVETLAYVSAEARPLFFALGAAAGLAAILYNKSLLATMATAAKFSASPARLPAGFAGALIAILAWLDFPLGAAAGLAAVAFNGALPGASGPRRPAPAELRAGLVGAMVGALAWFAPSLVGGGDPLTQSALAGTGTLAVIPLIFLLRLGLGAVSYAAGTPGGLFAPLLVLGAQLGLVFGQLCQLAFPDLDIQPVGFAVVGMAAFFTGVVRAPLTGIVLVSEMTASVAMLLPMLGACFVAMLVPTLLRNAPIYDSLRELTLLAAKKAYGASTLVTSPLQAWRRSGPSDPLRD